MRLSPQGTCFVAFAAFCCVSTALEIRNYNNDPGNIYGNQKWLFHVPGQWLWGSPPYINPDFSTFDATKLLAIGWPEDPNDWTRQIALVSPRHAVYATHYALGADWQINFLGTDGQQHQVGIESQVPIINSLGQQTDLMLVTFTSAVTAPGVVPYKVLNLANEVDYEHKPLLVCGSFVLAATTEVKGFTTLSNDPSFDTTRFIYFDYDRNASTDRVNLCNIRPGDSGGPLFVIENGQPVIVGVISSYDDLTPNDGIDGPKFRSYSSFIPSYMPELDAMMEAQGYHLKRFYPATTTLATTLTPDGRLRQLKPGSITIKATNFGAVMADNVNLTLTFPSPPTAVSGNGWICESAAPLVWHCRRGGIASFANATITASWNSLPTAEEMAVSVLQSYDGAVDMTSNPTVPVLETYASWSQGVSDPSFAADPDHDGICNLIEYAFGGSPNQASQTSADDRSLIPKSAKIGNSFVVRYPIRIDAAARGLTETPEFASNLLGWTSVLPDGASITSSPYMQGNSGFNEVSIAIPLASPMQYVRVRVALTE